MTITSTRQEGAPVPAPVDPAALERSLLPFGRSTMLPAEAYTSEAVLAWERRHLIAGTWPCLGRVEELRTGDATQRAVTVGDVPVLLTFGDPGEHGAGGVRAFANTCRHRGHELLPDGGEASKQSVVCPYHAWTYGLDGSLRAAPGFRENEYFVPAEQGLARAARRGVAGLGVRQRDGHRGALRRARRRAGRPRRPLRPGRPRRRGPAHVRDRRELEGHRGELPRVLPLPADPPGAVRGLGADLRRQLRPARRLGRWLDAAARRHADHVGQR